MQSDRFVTRETRQQFKKRVLNILDREYGGPYRARAKAALRDPGEMDIFGVAEYHDIRPIPKRAVYVARIYAAFLDGRLDLDDR